jgi:hypothetical protein
LTLSCADPVERLSLIKARDPVRARLTAILTAWWDAHADRPMTAATLAPAVLDLIDPQGRGRQFVASPLAKLAEARAAGFLFTRQESPGEWSAATYAVRQTPSRDADPPHDPYAPYDLRRLGPTRVTIPNLVLEWQRP